jgi:dihydrofolate synthase/folylpolyglutamate synthase
MINNILNKYVNNEKSDKFGDYSLEHIIKLLENLHNPHRNFKSIHIAGTNGKGTTAFLLAEILKNSGYKTGLYISPHLSKVNERIKINLHDIDDILLENYLKSIDTICINKSLSSTYFDILTAAAFKYFSDESVDIAVIETGLGGRLDSTNTLTPEISIITDISMDHINVLGDTIEKITEEKCGIIKDKIPVITSNDDPKIVSIIQEYAKRKKSQLYGFNSGFFTENIKRENNHFVFDYLSDKYNFNNIKISLFPAHQIKNTALVITALNHLRLYNSYNISDDVIYKTLENIQVPGRFQILNETPLVIYDPAHNFDALNNLVNDLNKFYPDRKKLFFVSMMKDKINDRIIELLRNINAVYITLPDERGYIPDKKIFKIISDKNNLIEIISDMNTIDEMGIITGTFRIYDYVLSAFNSCYSSVT